MMENLDMTQINDLRHSSLNEILKHNMEIMKDHNLHIVVGDDNNNNNTKNECDDDLNLSNGQDLKPCSNEDDVSFLNCL